MNMRQPTGSSGAADDRLERIEEVLFAHVRERLEGGEVSDQQLMARHPDLMPELAHKLRLLSDLSDAPTEDRSTVPLTNQGSGSAALRIRCPHCRQPLEILADTPFSDINCTACGSQFSLVGEATETKAARTFKKLGHFELIERLGLGGFGTVWKARDTELGRAVAVKIPRRGTLDAEDVGKFLREARAAAQLKHPNIVSVHEVGRDEDTVYIVSDLVRGVSLSDWLSARRPSFREAATLCAKIADALHHAHEAGVIHRDLKPQNIMMDGDGEPHLMDFGLARRDAGEITMTMDGHVLGTPAYMSPEQARGEAHQADRRTDVYSLGVILFELLTGDLPFRGNARMLVHQVLNDEPPSPRMLNNSVPRDLETISLKCMEKEPGRRYHNANAVRAELLRYCENKPIEARPIGTVSRGFRWCRRNPVVSGLSLAVVGTLLLGTIVASWQAQWAKREAASSARNGYIVAMNLVQSEWERGNLAQVRALLKETSAYPDRRFEWFHWLQTAHERERSILGHVGMVNCVAASKDGSWFVTGGHHQSKVWETSTGKELFTIEEDLGMSTPLPVQSYGINGVSISSDSNWVATCSLDGSATIWNRHTGERERTFKGGHAGPVWDVAFSPDGSRLVTTSQDGKAIVWDVASGEIEKTLVDGHGNIFDVAFSPDGSQIATAGADFDAVIWDALSYEIVARLEGHKDWVFSLDYSPDGTTLVTASHDGVAKLWDSTNGQPLPVTFTGHRGDIKHVRFAPSGDRIVTAGEDGTARLWDAHTGAQLRVLLGHEAGVWSVAFAGDDRVITAAHDGVINVWNVTQDPNRLLIKGDSPPNESTQGMSIDVSADGNRIAVGCSDFTVRILDGKSKRQLKQLKGHSNRVWTVALTRDGRQALSGGADNKAILWDCDTGEQLLVLDQHLGGVRDAAFSPDGELMATACEDGIVRLWDVTTGKQRHLLKGHLGPVWTLAFSRDGQWIVTAGADTLCKTWDTASGQPKYDDFREHEGAVMSVATASNGLVLSGGVDRAVRIWNPATGKVMQTLAGHNEAIVSVGILPDGARFVTASRGSSVKLWNTEAGREVLTLSGNGVSSAVMSADGGMILAAGNGNPYLWQAATPDQVERWLEEEDEASTRIRRLAQQRDEFFEQKKLDRQHDPGAIKRWLVLAPIPFRQEDGQDVQQAGLATLLENDVFDKSLRPRVGLRHTIDHQDFYWREVALDDYRIDFNELSGQQADTSFGYAVCYIVSQQARSELQLRIASDDQCKVILNEETKFICEFGRSYLADSDIVRNISLVPGVNTLVLKITNLAADWEGSVRLTDRDGRPVPGISVTLDPDRHN